MKKLTTSNVILICLVAMCVIRIPCAFIRFSFQMAVECGVMFVFAWIVGRQNKWAGMLFALIIVSSLFASTGTDLIVLLIGSGKAKTAITANYDIFSYLTCRTVLIGFIWYWIISTKYTDKILDGLCVIAICSVIMLVLQSFNIDPLYTPVDGKKEAVVGLMSNPNEVSALLAICTYAFFRKKMWYGLAIIGVGLILSRSCGGVVAACAGASLFLILRGYKFIGTAVPVIFVIAYLLIDTPAAQERLNAWVVGTELYSAKWAFGYGLGHWATEFLKVSDPRIGKSMWQYAHNEYLQGTFEMGPMFMVVLMGYGFNIIRRVRKLKKVVPAKVLESLYPHLAGAMTVAVNAGVNFVFHIGTTAIIAVTILGGLEYKLRQLE